MSKKNKKQQNRNKKQAAQLSQVPVGFTLADCAVFEEGKPPIVDTRKMLWLYYSGKYAEVVQLIVNVSAAYEKYIFAKLARKDQTEVDKFVFTALYILTRPDFNVPPKSFVNLMAAAPIFNNVVSISSVQSTDGALRSVLVQDNNLFKVLPLCTARNEAQVNVPGLFDSNDHLASLWWLQYATGVAGYTQELTHKNVQAWLSNIPDKLKLPDWRCVPLYFQATYINPDKDRLVKKRMNDCIQAHLPAMNIVIKNEPKPKRIAVVSARWYSCSAVYKTSEPHIRALKERGYDMDLIHLGNRDSDSIIEKDVFSKIKYAQISRGGLEAKELLDNDYEAIYYTDIGMNNESVWLSNMRLAPLQIMGLGHPVSTFGSKIDYIITGDEVEHPKYVQDNYYERVVLIPGLGATPVNPKYTLKNVEKATPPDFMINCCWTAPKINYPMLEALVEVKKRSKRKVVYHFLPSWTVGRQNSAIAFLRDVRVLFGDDVLVTAERPYQQYLEKMEAGNLSLVPHPFGGYNTVVDSFAVGLPCVAIEGTKWYNRCGPGLLRRCGFDDLIVDSIDSYVNKIVEIVDNEGYWSELMARLTTVDLEKTLYRTDEPEYFADAFDYLLANHSRLQAENKQTPIRIGC